jgi:hypothetical protein
LLFNNLSFLESEGRNEKSMAQEKPLAQYVVKWSQCHAVAGSARSRATAEGKRQAAVMMKKGTSQMLDFWSGGLSARSAPKKKKRR